jgi:transcriptional regulator with XRE-family HTH domain
VTKKTAKTAPPPAPAEVTTLPDRLKYARKRVGFAQKELAERSQGSESQLSGYESAERVEGVEAATVIRLARALGVPVGWLVADEGEPGPVPVFTEPPRGDRRRRKPDGGKGE